MPFAPNSSRKGLAYPSRRIGRSFMGNPELLLVNERTEGLAPNMVQEVRDVPARINKAGVSCCFDPEKIITPAGIRSSNWII
jgi:ABC-type branched-subunit amino acid transport system ATPase component